MPEVTYQCEFAECTWETKTNTVSDYVALTIVDPSNKYKRYISDSTSSTSMNI